MKVTKVRSRKNDKIHFVKKLKSLQLLYKNQLVNHTSGILIIDNIRDRSDYIKHLQS